VSAPAFTPGPWQYLRSPSGPIRVGPSHNCTVAVAPFPPTGDQEANARLIAASPDLCAALSNLLADLAPITNELHNGKINGGWPPTAGDARAVASELVRISAPARAALAKVQGAQS